MKKHNYDGGFSWCYAQMIYRSQWHDRIEAALKRSRILTLVGPRQCGKTTLARDFVAEDSANYFDLEDPVSLARLEFPTEFRDSIPITVPLIAELIVI